MRSRLTRVLFVLSVLAPTAAMAAPKNTEAKKGSPGACGAKILPLAVGNSWTYVSVPAPAAAAGDVIRITPNNPKSFVITVKSIDDQGGDTVVTLEERLTYELKDRKKPTEERIVKSTTTCSGNGKKFDVSPDSFLFAGEPGGYHGITISKLERKGTSLQLVGGTIGEAKWQEDLLVTWTEAPSQGVTAKLGSGTLELERVFQPAEPESVSTKQGTYLAEKIAVTTTGRVRLDSPRSQTFKQQDLPPNWTNQLWLAEGVGVVQTLNAFAHMYQLSEVTLK
ncbi:MAG: hypothetical protein AB7R00_00860 [Kofleriaceae bacterium]